MPQKNHRRSRSPAFLPTNFVIDPNYYVSDEFLQQLQSVLSHCKAGNENAAVEALAHCWDVPLPHLFYPQYNLETRTKIMMFLFGVEIFLERFTEAEKMVARIGVTKYS